MSVCANNQILTFIFLIFKCYHLVTLWRTVEAVAGSPTLWWTHAHAPIRSIKNCRYRHLMCWNDWRWHIYGRRILILECVFMSLLKYIFVIVLMTSNRHGRNVILSFFIHTFFCYLAKKLETFPLSVPLGFSNEPTYTMPWFSQLERSHFQCN